MHSRLARLLCGRFFGVGSGEGSGTKHGALLLIQYLLVVVAK